MPNPETGVRISEIAKEGNHLDEISVAYVDRLTRSRLDRLGAVLINTIGVNPKLHFTTTSFIFNPDTERDRVIFRRSAISIGWQVSDTYGKIETHTGNLDNILEKGLRAGTCVATIPSGVSEDLVVSHPRLALDAFRNAVFLFGKHSLPYKQSPIQRTNGVLEDVSGALVIVDGKVSARAKGQMERDGLTRSNLLRPSTHIIDDGATPLEILAVVPFSLSEPTISRHGVLRPNVSSLVEDVFSGAREVVRRTSLGQAEDQPQLIRRYVAMLNCFKPIANANSMA